MACRNEKIRASFSNAKLPKRKGEGNGFVAKCGACPAVRRRSGRCVADRPQLTEKISTFWTDGALFPPRSTCPNRPSLREPLHVDLEFRFGTIDREDRDLDRGGRIPAFDRLIIKLTEHLAVVRPAQRIAKLADILVADLDLHAGRRMENAPTAISESAETSLFLPALQPRPQSESASQAALPAGFGLPGHRIIKNSQAAAERASRSSRGADVRRSCSLKPQRRLLLDARWRDGCERTPIGLTRGAGGASGRRSRCGSSSGADRWAWGKASPRREGKPPAHAGGLGAQTIIDKADNAPTRRTPKAPAARTTTPPPSAPAAAAQAAHIRMGPRRSSLAFGRRLHEGGWRWAQEET